MHWLILASRLDQELYAIWNSASISTKNALGLCRKSDSTEPRNSSRLLHSMRLTVLRKFFNFSLRCLEGDSFSFCLIDSFFFIKLSIAPDIQGMGFRPSSLFGLYIVRDRYKKRVFPLMPVSIHSVIGYDRREDNC